MMTSPLSTKRKFNSAKIYLNLILLVFLFGCKSNNAIKIGVYSFNTPDWWNDIEVSLPESIKTEDDARQYIKLQYGADVGTKNTWKSALKSWVLFDERTNGFPVYIGHCFMTGEDYKNAAKVFSDLYFLANTQKEEEYWYKCFLAFEVGEAYRKLKEYDKAITWYSYSVKVKYKNSEDSAIKYYSDQSSERIIELNKQISQ